MALPCLASREVSFSIWDQHSADSDSGGPSAGRRPDAQDEDQGSCAPPHPGLPFAGQSCVLGWLGLQRENALSGHSLEKPHSSPASPGMRKMKPAPAGERSQGLAATAARQRKDDAPEDTIPEAWPEPVDLAGVRLLPREREAAAVEMAA